jgi:hypothetical protein
MQAAGGGGICDFGGECEFGAEKSTRHVREELEGQRSLKFDLKRKDEENDDRGRASLSTVQRRD